VLGGRLVTPQGSFVLSATVHLATILAYAAVAWLVVRGPVGLLRGVLADEARERAAGPAPGVTTMQAPKEDA